MVPQGVSRVRLWSSLRTEIVLKVILLTVTIVLLLSIVAIKIVEREILRQRLRSAERVIVALHEEVMSRDPAGASAPLERRADFQRGKVS